MGEIGIFYSALKKVVYIKNIPRVLEKHLFHTRNKNDLFSTTVLKTNNCEMSSF